MIALRLVRLIEDHADVLAEQLLKKFRESEKTRDFARVPAEELRDRVREILQHLGEWLLHKKESEIEVRYREIGARRASQQVALSDYCWAIGLTKDHLWEFLQRQGFLQSIMDLYGELELLRLLDQFFDRAMYYVTVGYEQAESLNQFGASEGAGSVQAANL